MELITDYTRARLRALAEAAAGWSVPLPHFAARSAACDALKAEVEPGDMIDLLNAADERDRIRAESEAMHRKLQGAEFLWAVADLAYEAYSGGSVEPDHQFVHALQAHMAETLTGAPRDGGSARPA